MTLDVSDYRVTFGEDFGVFNWNVAGATAANPNAPPTGFWNTHYWSGFGDRWLFSNNELQYYADPDAPVSPFSLDPTAGVLTITARPSTDLAASGSQPYTSGLLTTEGVFWQTYGYFEIRAQVPEGQGLWPAFWLLPQDHSWPPEIDVLELLGSDPETYYTNLITHDPTVSVESRFRAHQVEDLSQDFHNYGVKWTPNTIEFYLDRELVSAHPTPADMHKPMYMVANLAVGGWAGAPETTTVFPAEFRIDSIYAYALPPDQMFG